MLSLFQFFENHMESFLSRHPKLTLFFQIYSDGLKAQIKNILNYFSLFVIVMTDFHWIWKLTLSIFYILICPLFAYSVTEAEEDDGEEVFASPVLNFDPNRERWNVSIGDVKRREKIGWIDARGLFIESPCDIVILLSKEQLLSIKEQCEIASIKFPKK